MKPILFSTDMVKAILAGRKTQTRRVVKPQPITLPQGFYFHPKKNIAIHIIGNPSKHTAVTKHCPYGQIGDILWVRETWAEYGPIAGKFHYKADHINGPYVNDFKWKPSIHMPREACRLFLRITSVRVERLQNITEADAIAEGIQYNSDAPASITNKGSFAKLWESINGPASWQANPWVWVVEFERTEKPANWP